MHGVLHIDNCLIYLNSGIRSIDLDFEFFITSYYTEIYAKCLILSERPFFFYKCGTTLWLLINIEPKTLDFKFLSRETLFRCPFNDVPYLNFDELKGRFLISL